MKKCQRSAALSVLVLAVFGAFLCSRPDNKASDRLIPTDKNLSDDWLRALTASGGRRPYSSEELLTIGMPCGGIGAGQLYVRGDGTLAQWWIANNAYGTAWWWEPLKPEVRRGASFETPLGIYCGAYRTYQPPAMIEQGFAIGVEEEGQARRVNRLSRRGFSDPRFYGEYPIARIEYISPVGGPLPVKVTAEVFSPFIPLNARDSAQPATVLRYIVKNTSSRRVAVRLAGWLQNPVCLDLVGRAEALSRNVVVHDPGLTSISMDVLPLRGALAPTLRQDPRFGNMALAALKAKTSATADCVSVERLLDALSGGKELSVHASASRPLGTPLCGALETSFELEPGATKNADFLLTWFFPGRTDGPRAANNWGQPLGGGPRVGQMYGNWFKSSLDVARRMAADFDRLDRETHLFHDTYFDTTLPYWFAQRVGMPVANLATETCQWWENGRFYGWEGVGCCDGTCTHVWHYEQALGRLFPELARSIREMQNLNPETGFDPKSGGINDRGKTPGIVAIDGQGGVIMACYRQAQMSADDGFLRRNWPRLKLAIEYLIAQDGNGDGLIENEQPNTYDISFFGANTLSGSLYLASLRAGEEMALRLSDEPFARRCRSIFESGRKLTMKRLWNGEFFIQDVDLGKHPNFQYVTGCLSDQMIGQAWAHQVGLGYLFPPEAVRSALLAVYKYNWTPDVGPYNAVHKPEIIFADPGEAGLFLCTWPESRHLKENGVRYHDTVWSGIEGQVAAHMIAEGLITEGLAVLRGVHERYDGRKHNPWNQILCGDHYARAMSSWGCLIAACGFTYDGPSGRIGFAPRIGADDFKAFFSAAEGWGAFSQRRDRQVQTEIVEVRWGRLRLQSLEFELPGRARLKHAGLTLGGRTLACRVEQDGRRVGLKLERDIAIEAAESLKVELKY
jgi:uncharacterized protein (DUF608 family)